MSNFGKLLIKRDEMVLIKNSQTAMDMDIYGNLFACLQKYDTLTVGDFEKDDAFDEKAKVVILDNKKMLIDSVTEEWTSLELYEDETKKTRCQLCNTPNKYIYYIKNDNTSKELNVGSECVKRFPKVKNVKKAKKTFEEEKIIKNEQKRRIEFGEKESSDPHFLKEAEEKFKNIDILLPYDLYEKIKENLYQLNSIKTNYIKNGGEKENTFKLYDETKEQFRYLWKLAIKFYKENKNDKLICNGSTARWLQENNPEVWEKIAKNNGMFNENTLKKVYQKEYVEQHIDDFKKCFEETDTSIVEVSGNIIKFKIENDDYRYPLIFYVSYKNFMETIGCYCIAQNRYVYKKEDLKNLIIEDTKQNFNSMYNRIKNIIIGIGFDIDIDENTETMYYKMLPVEMKKNSKWSKNVKRTEVKYKKFGRRQFFNVFIQIIFADNREIEKRFRVIFNKLKNNGTEWISEEEKNKYSDLAKGAAAMQKQREFIPYS